MPIDPQTSERLTWKQICERYPDEWAVLTELNWDEETDSQWDSAVVLGHFKSRKDASSFIKAAFQHYNDIGSFFTGEIRISIPCFLLPWVMGRRTGIDGDGDASDRRELESAGFATEIVP